MWTTVQGGSASILKYKKKRWGSQNVILHHRRVDFKVLQQNLSVGRFAENGETLSRLAIANNSLVMAARWLLILGIPSIYLGPLAKHRR